MNRISFLAAVLVTAAITASPALAATAPVGLWKLDEGSGTHVADSSGNGNNGVLSGGVSWVPGASGSALSFDGSTGEVKVADNTVLEPHSTVTVSAWVKQAGSPGDFRYVVAKGANGCIAASYGLYSGPDGGLEFYVSQGQGSIYARSPDAGQDVWDGKWHLAVGTYDGSTIRLYLDGVEVGTGTPWAGSLEYLLPDSNDFYIGNYPGCADHEFLGAVDDVAVWNRTLGTAEIGGLLQPGDPAGQPTSPSGGGGGNQGGGNQSGGNQGGGNQGGGTTHTTPGNGGGTKTNTSAPSIRRPEAVDLDGHGRRPRPRHLRRLVRTVAQLHRVGGGQPHGDAAALREGRAPRQAVRRAVRPRPRPHLHALRRHLERHAHRPTGPLQPAARPVAPSPAEPGHLPARRDPAGLWPGRQDGERPPGGARVAPAALAERLPFSAPALGGTTAGRSSAGAAGAP